MSDNEVKPGQRLSARMWNALLRLIRRARPLAGRGINITQTPAGTIIEAAGSAAKEFLLARVSSVNGDNQGNQGQAYPSGITYGVKIKERPELGEVTFAAAAIIRGVKGDDFKVWPMPLNTWVCVEVTPTDDPAKPIKLMLVAIEAPFTEVCASGGNP